MDAAVETVVVLFLIFICLTGSKISKLASSEYDGQMIHPVTLQDFLETASLFQIFLWALSQKDT